MDVCFLALGAARQMDASTSIIRNIEAQTSKRVRYHLLVDKPRAQLHAQMQSSVTAWRGVPKSKLHLHSVRRLSPETKALYDGGHFWFRLLERSMYLIVLTRARYKRLASSATGPGPIYLYKPLLHLVLPRWLEKVIVLDTDIFLFSDIAQLWAAFARFGPSELIGVAEEQAPATLARALTPALIRAPAPTQTPCPEEQAPSYQEVRALGGFGVNGGVQLLALDKMRASASYAARMASYASRGHAGLPMKPGGIGWLGDQTLYSWMSANGSKGGRAVFHMLPCGWNRQIGTHMAAWPGFWARHACASRCHLLHGNYMNHKGLMESLKARRRALRPGGSAKWTSHGGRFSAGRPNGPLVRRHGAAAPHGPQIQSAGRRAHARRRGARVLPRARRRGRGPRRAGARGGGAARAEASARASSRGPRARPRRARPRPRSRPSRNAVKTLRKSLRPKVINRAEIKAQITVAISKTPCGTAAAPRRPRRGPRTLPRPEVLTQHAALLRDLEPAAEALAQPVLRAVRRPAACRRHDDVVRLVKPAGALVHTSPVPPLCIHLGAVFDATHPFRTPTRRSTSMRTTWPTRWTTWRSSASWAPRGPSRWSRG